MTILERIVIDSRAALEQRKALRSSEELRARIAPALPGRMRAALAGPGMAIIAEYKRRSPSAGEIRADLTVADVARAYAAGGAAAMSVLTEERHFAGSLGDLRAARAACDLPLLRKDFIVDEYQLLEAAEAGAAAILLIVAALSDARLRELSVAAYDLGLDALVEVHDRAELARALAAGADLIGINNRDLRDFSVDLGRTFEVLRDVPAGVTIVAESGIRTLDQLERLGAAGVDAALLGEALMRAPDPRFALAELVGAALGSPSATESRPI
jgi:indole-3-glycerol phosphate synthase